MKSKFSIIDKAPVENIVWSDAFPKVEDLRTKYFKRCKKNEKLLSKFNKKKHNIDETITKVNEVTIKSIDNMIDLIKKSDTKLK